MTTKSYFDLMELAESAKPDLGLLNERYRQLQSRSEYRTCLTEVDPNCTLAIQELNRAYHTLKSSAKRVVYLLKLRGIECHSLLSQPIPLELKSFDSELTRNAHLANQAAEPQAYAELEAKLEELNKLEQNYLDQFADALGSEQIDLACAAAAALHHVDQYKQRVEVLEERLEE